MRCGSGLRLWCPSVMDGLRLRLPSTLSPRFASMDKKWDSPAWLGKRARRESYLGNGPLGLDWSKRLFLYGELQGCFGLAILRAEILIRYLPSSSLSIENWTFFSTW